MKEQNSQPDVGKLIQQLVELLQNGHAHVTLNDAVKDIPFELLGKKPGGLTYSIWQIAEHIRIAQWDILDFSRNKNYKEMKWPEDYWPQEDAPESEAAWNDCIKQINEDQGSFIDLLHAHAGDLFKPISHGSGQTLLREALLIADHNSYHVGQIVVIRRLLGNWN
ncbi:MAG TPA: DinB family protein [Parafilimonas sp.]|nr:DinB family protein [Parafilimonas sp.]